MTLRNGDFLGGLNWIDGRPLVVEPYRRRLFEQFFDAVDGAGRPRYNLALTGRAKKNFKSADLVLASLYALLADAPGGNQCYLLANDEGQAGDDLALAKRLIAANPALRKALAVKKKEISRRDGRGFLMILPAQDVAGSHGKTYRLCGFDEIHAYRTWDLLEAMQLDPTRPEAQMWITSYASLYHRPAAPLFDLFHTGKAGTDPRMLFSWYAADFTTDPDFADADPEARANPSRGAWQDPDYLEQQRRRLPAHKFRRLHLNLPGLPEGSAFQPEPIMDAVARGVPARPPEPGVSYAAFVDMSGGSNDDAVLAVGFTDADGRAVVCRVVNQGQPPPFDPRRAVERFVGILREYSVSRVTGDRYAGETFRADFERQGIAYKGCAESKSALYEALEAPLNGRCVSLPDVPDVEQQLLGLVWRGGKIDHPAGERDDWANAVAGLVTLLVGKSARPPFMFWTGDGQGWYTVQADGSVISDRERAARREALEREQAEIAHELDQLEARATELEPEGGKVEWIGEDANVVGGGEDRFDAAEAQILVEAHPDEEDLREDEQAEGDRQWRPEQEVPAHRAEARDGGLLGPAGASRCYGDARHRIRSRPGFPI